MEGILFYDSLFIPSHSHFVHKIYGRMCTKGLVHTEYVTLSANI